MLALASASYGLTVGVPAAPAAGRAAAPTMAAAESRRNVLAAALLLAPSAANAMTIPGLNAPGLVPATKKPAGAKPSFESYRDTSHFWSSQGVRAAARRRRSPTAARLPLLHTCASKGGGAPACSRLRPL